MFPHWLDLEAEQSVIERGQSGTSVSTKMLDQERKSIKEQTESYLDKYGASWARASSSKMALHDKLGRLVVEEHSDDSKSGHI